MLLKDRVAVVTGAGRGIGREIALMMAEAGAGVIVNDLGGREDGTGAGASPADDVVKQIQAAGGQACASYESVASMAGGRQIIGMPLDMFGRIDIVVNNAGIVRDRMILVNHRRERAGPPRDDAPRRARQAQPSQMTPPRPVTVRPSHSSAPSA
jgi:NAD(P)-dependent dehydrogenase (short-subunit alcohol dehydrogenase family)